MSYLKIDRVVKSFSGPGGRENVVLNDIRLNIEKGEFISIIGHSGCGKSTLLNLIGGLTQVTTGAIKLEGREVNAPGPDRAIVFHCFSCVSAAFHKVLRSAYSGGAWGGSMISVWTIPRFSE